MSQGKSADVLPFNPPTAPSEAAAAAMDDAAIAELGRRDRTRALSAVVAKYRRPLYRHAFHMLHNAEEAYEIVQEVFLRAHKETRLFDVDFHIKGWLYRVTANLCLKHIRSRRVRAMFALRRPEAEPEVTPPVAVAIAGQVQKEVAEALEELPPRFRQLVVLRYFDDLSYKEIADAMKMPIGSVMSGLSRARERLKKLLKNTETEE
ncbi:MAG TPA: RNA polymerase sigma factor [bacterium]|nr:RNA polymerase sigma factor [bacterium]